MKKIAMFGGTFNPPHSGHVAAARACVQKLNLDELIVIPTAIPPHKVMPEGSPTPLQRLEMCRLAFEDVPCARVSDMELVRGGASYTLDTLKELKKQYPDDTLYIIMGTDMLLSFAGWREPEAICSLATIAAVSRNEGEREALTQAAEDLKARFGAKVEIVDNTPLSMSSTEARGGNRVHLPQKVRQYMADNALYVDLDTLRRQVSARMSVHRWTHTLGCEKMAAELAQLYGENEHLCRVCAILHDVTKELPIKEQLKLCEKWNIIYDYDSLSLEPVIHADTAATVAREEFGMGEPIFEAIKKHTVGDKNMSLLDKILFVADAGEEGRVYEMAPLVRKAAFYDLDEAVLLAIESTRTRLAAFGRLPYYKTFEARDAILEKRREEEK